MFPGKYSSGCTDFFKDLFEFMEFYWTISHDCQVIEKDRTTLFNNVSWDLYFVLIGLLAR